MAITVVLCLIGGGVAFASRDPGGSQRYRVATVAERRVDQLLDLVGTVNPVSAVTISFPVSGTVSALDVAVGDQVVLGQQLASLDQNQLEASLNEARASLAKAELAVEVVISRIASAQEASAVAAASASSGGEGNSSAPIGSLAAGEAASSGELQSALQAVLDAQRSASVSLSSANAAIRNSEAVCGDGASDRV
ncbi:MAG: biotin/lipoyl-binding protein [Microthrixaceae bacterium]